MIAIIVISLILVTLLIHHTSRKPKKYPPGPLTVPVIGSIFSINFEKPQITLDGLHEKYGPHVGLIIGGFRGVVVSGVEAVNEALLNDDLLGRPDVCLTRDRFDGESYGLFFTDGEDWRIQRRFALHHFRNLGFGRKSQLTLIQEEAEELVNVIREKQEKPFCLTDVVSISSHNLNWAYLGGRRFSHGDEKIRRIQSYISDSLKSVKMFGSPAVVLPFLRYIFPERMGYNGIKRGTRGLRAFIQQEVKEHEATRDPNNPRDFIDFYLEELQKPEAHPSFSVVQLEGICVDMLMAGGDTSVSVLSFAILFLSLRKDLQDKAYTEILEQVGTNRLPTNEDKTKLPYIEAIINEILRMRTPAPNTAPHRALRDTTLGDYYIPKDTIVFPNLCSVFMDKTYWKDPETFRPERFITEEGKFRRDDRLIPFGKGKRMCIGETLFRSSSLIFLASMIQNFSFSLDPNLPIPKTEGIPGFTVTPPYFQVVATPRS